MESTKKQNILFNVDSFDLIELSKRTGDILKEPYVEGKAPYMSNKIADIRQIQSGENFFLCACLDAVRKALGLSEEFDLPFFSSVTGDMFVLLYGSGKPCDSGFSNYFFIPDAIKFAIHILGYSCTYISPEAIQNDFDIVMNLVKASVDKGIPVIAGGMGNVTLADGSYYDPLPEFCLIGGYDEGNILYANLYADGLPEDEHGYCRIENGLKTTKGLFIVGEKEQLDYSLAEIYQEIVNTIPKYLTLESVNGYTFGKKAFTQWADTLIDDKLFDNNSDEELSEVCWNLHLTSYCVLCTSLGRVCTFLDKALKLNPDFIEAQRALPLFERLSELNKEIWALQGGFSPPNDKFRMHDYRQEIATILMNMGKTCEEIVEVF